MNPNELAFPLLLRDADFPSHEINRGLTKRELFAILAMQGLLATKLGMNSRTTMLLQGSDIGRTTPSHQSSVPTPSLTNFQNPSHEHPRSQDRQREPPLGV